MTKLLEQAIAQARELSEAEQDAIGDALFAHFAGDGRYRLSAEQAADVARIRDDLRSGKTRLATDEEVSAVWKSAGFEGPLYDRRAAPYRSDSFLHQRAQSDCSDSRIVRVYAANVSEMPDGA